MNCKHFREWIAEAALGALDASRLAQLRTHFAECASCLREFEGEQRLLAMIDQGIAARVEGAPSAGFAARVRMRLAQESESARRRAWWQPAVWSPALGLATLAVVLLALWFVRRMPHPRAPERARVAAPSAPSHPDVPSGERKRPEQMARVIPPGAASPASRAVRTNRPGASGARRSQSLPAASDQAPQLKVLVQPGQAEALGALYRAMQRGPDPIGLAAQSAKTEPPLNIQAVEVNPIAIAELQLPEPIDPTAEK